MQYSDLHRTHQRIITKFDFEAISMAISDEFDYAGAKNCVLRYYTQKGDGKKKKAFLEFLAGKQKAYAIFQARLKDFEKLRRQIRKDIIQVKTEQVTLSFYFWPIACYAYRITTTKGEYTFTLSVESKMSID